MLDTKTKEAIETLAYTEKLDSFVSTVMIDKIIALLIRKKVITPDEAIEIYTLVVSKLKEAPTNSGYQPSNSEQEEEFDSLVRNLEHGARSLDPKSRSM